MEEHGEGDEERDRPGKRHDPDTPADGRDEADDGAEQLDEQSVNAVGVGRGAESQQNDAHRYGEDVRQDGSDVPHADTSSMKKSFDFPRPLMDISTARTAVTNVDATGVDISRGLV